MQMPDKVVWKRKREDVPGDKRPKWERVDGFLRCDPQAELIVRVQHALGYDVQVLRDGIDPNKES